MSNEVFSAAALLAMRKTVAVVGIEGMDDVNKARLEVWLAETRTTLQGKLASAARDGNTSIRLRTPVLTNSRVCKDGRARWTGWQYGAYVESLLTAPLETQLQAMVGEGVRVTSTGGDVGASCGGSDTDVPEDARWEFEVAWGTPPRSSLFEDDDW
jgi:hypothetical protein